MSAAEELLNELEVTADPFALCEVIGGGTLGLGRDAGATLHYVLQGRGRFLLSGGQVLEVAPGTLVFLPAGQAHTLEGRGGPALSRPAACRAAELGLAHLVQDDGADRDAARLVALCARVSLGLRGAPGVVEMLRAPLVVGRDDVNGLGHAVDALLHELRMPAPGGRAMVRALLLQCVLAMLRARAMAGDAATGWMPLLADTRLRRAVMAMLNDPAAPHRLEDLAALAGMSRSAFAQHFAACHGDGPASFLRDLRMSRAAVLLARGDVPVERVATQVGFASRSAFSRAFLQAHGVAPAAFRHHAAPEAVP